MFDPNDSATQARATAAKAKDGTVRIDGEVYALTFDSIEWVYVVTKGREPVVRLNVKTLPAAKRALMEWLA